MNIHSVEFAGAIGQVGQDAPESVKGLPRVAFSGRSNVGKSSLVNRFLGRTRTPIARVSQTPGKTQEINFYHVRSDVAEFVLVDLPGYGFARAPEDVREKWGQVIDSFLQRRENLRGVVQLLDIRRGATPDDLTALEHLVGLQLPTLVVLTKGDKLKPQKRAAATREVVQSLGLDAAQVITSSSLSGMGIEEMQNAIASLVADSGDDLTDPGRTP